jgi:predicted enzyme related to lactoylglutathione lyase
MVKRSIVHLEIPAQDREAGAQFYARLCGWTFEHVPEPMPYTMFETGNVGIGMPDFSEQYKAGDTIIYIASDDVAADLKQVETLGGKTLTPPFDVGDFGRMAFFADPSGNRLALWQEMKQDGG